MGRIGRALPQRSAWLRGPIWDGVWLQSALWLAPLALLVSRGSADPESSPLDLLYFGVTALFWIGHRLCSTWLAYCTEAYRPILRTQPVRFILLPLLVTAVCFAVFLPSDSSLPWSRAERVVAFAIVDYALVTYHFAAQHFGVLSLYRLRAGRRAVAARHLDRLFTLGVGVVLVFVADVLAGAAEYQDLWLDPWLPVWLTAPDAQDTIREIALFLLLVSTAAMLVAEMLASWRSLPHVLYVLGIAATAAVALRPQSVFLFLVVSTSQHWIVATALASRTPSAEPAPPTRGAVRRMLHGLNTRPWALTLLLMLTSILLLPLFEVEAIRQGGTFYGDRLFGVFATQLRTSSWVPGLVALGFATAFVHYLLDRSVYRLSNPQVRAAARGLLTTPNPRLAGAARHSVLPMRPAAESAQPS